MHRLVVLGAGTAGTIVANKLRGQLPEHAWTITIVDQDDTHLYQPGLLLLPFDIYTPDELVKPRAGLLSDGVELVISPVERVVAEDDLVLLANGRELHYDYLVIATGTSPRPEQTPGMLGTEWRKSIFDFYTPDGAIALRDKLADWAGGRLVVHINEMPIKCPVAPLEFAFLADSFFEERNMRDKVEITYVTPLEGAFTKPIATKRLSRMLSDRDIEVVSDFIVDRIDDDRKTLVSMDEREVPFDLLVTVPVNMGADYIARSDLGDELNHVPVDHGTLRSADYPKIFALGDAAAIPTSKAGSAAHFAVEVFVKNFFDLLAGRPLTHRFDGHVNCFVESGSGKGLLIDFNYDTEPLPGHYPVPGVGPFSLLEETRANHLGKLGFRHAYWHLLLKGRPLPIPTAMSMAGKHTDG
ncbi:MAG TPA: FAD/NAD(P)-binding oxidoreductase [Mycobacteriales bacterium]|nr:FAD/NAD(P)-binding oxidoreductase [Mycobacteriales bacterium]